MPGKVFIHATNVHQGGGRSLLEALLKALPDKTACVLSVDARMPIPTNLSNNLQIKEVKPSLLRRMDAERWLARNVSQQDMVLCFGNLPPLFKLSGHTVVFVQNRYLIDDAKLTGFPLKVRLRLALERLWLSQKMIHADEFVVQTPTMKRLLESKTQGRVPVSILPFVAEPKSYPSNEPKAQAQKDPNCRFVYVASGEPHKNHQRLIEAWRLLAEADLFPTLCLTLDQSRFADLYSKIETMRRQYGLQITNTSGLSHKDVLALYNEADAAIYPSTFESFGLPLIEARQAGLPVLAAELDYVRDVLDPEQSFDPESAISIARAVKRFMGIREPNPPLLDAKEFLDRVFWKAK